MQNDEARLRRLPTRPAKALTPPLRKYGPRQVVAIPGSQFQKAELAIAAAAQQFRATQRSFVPFGFETRSLPALARRCPRGFAFCLAVPTARLRISDFEFRFVAGPASGARRDTKRKRERTSRSCIAR